jgi:hypothetical protein
MHEKELALRERIGNQVAGALADLARSFADFTKEIAKRK